MSGRTTMSKKKSNVVHSEDLEYWVVDDENSWSFAPDDFEKVFEMLKDGYFWSKGKWKWELWQGDKMIASHKKWEGLFNLYYVWEEENWEKKNK